MEAIANNVDLNQWFREETRRNIEYYNMIFKQSIDKHPALEYFGGDRKKVNKQRLTAAWKTFKSKLDWDIFTNITSTLLLAEREGEEVENLTEMVEAYITWTLDDLGIEVKKIRNGFKVSAEKADREIRNIVMDLVINHNLLSAESVLDIKCKLYKELIG